MRNAAEAPLTWAVYVTRLRTGAGMSRPQLAQRLGVSPATVWRWETGKQRPESPEAPEALAKLFGREPDEALESAGLRVTPVQAIEPVRQADGELAMILAADLPEAVQEELILTLERERDEDRRRRMERTQRMIDLYRRRAG